MGMDCVAYKVAVCGVEPLRQLYRHEAHCQIIHDSALPRGFADAYLIHIHGRIAGYGGVWTKYDPGRLFEFYSLPAYRALARPMFESLLAASNATQLEAQTNMPRMFELFNAYALNVVEEKILFEDTRCTSLHCHDAQLRKATPDDAARIFEHQDEPVGDWVIESASEIVATGGFYCHYNPPYADIFMEVAASARGKGYGSFLVQELKRVCYESGKKPAARCSPTNIASRRTMEKAGLAVAGKLLVGAVRHNTQS